MLATAAPELGGSAEVFLLDDAFPQPVSSAHARRASTGANPMMLAEAAVSGPAGDNDGCGSAEVLLLDDAFPDAVSHGHARRASTGANPMLSDAMVVATMGGSAEVLLDDVFPQEEEEAPHQGRGSNSADKDGGDEPENNRRRSDNSDSHNTTLTLTLHTTLLHSSLLAKNDDHPMLAEAATYAAAAADQIARLREELAVARENVGASELARHAASDTRASFDTPVRWLIVCVQRTAAEFKKRRAHRSPGHCRVRGRRRARRRRGARAARGAY